MTKETDEIISRRHIQENTVSGLILFFKVALNPTLVPFS